MLTAFYYSDMSRDFGAVRDAYVRRKRYAFS
jgi:hypothetical protein